MAAHLCPRCPLFTWPCCPLAAHPGGQVMLSISSVFISQGCLNKSATNWVASNSQDVSSGLQKSAVKGLVGLCSFPGSRRGSFPPRPAPGGPRHSEAYGRTPLPPSSHGLPLCRRLYPLPVRTPVGSEPTSVISSDLDFICKDPLSK